MAPTAFVYKHEVSAEQIRYWSIRLLKSVEWSFITWERETAIFAEKPSYNTSSSALSKFHSWNLLMSRASCHLIARLCFSFKEYRPLLREKKTKWILLSSEVLWVLTNRYPPGVVLTEGVKEILSRKGSANLWMSVTCSLLGLIN